MEQHSPRSSSPSSAAQLRARADARRRAEPTSAGPSVRGGPAAREHLHLLHALQAFDGQMRVDLPAEAEPRDDRIVRGCQKVGVMALQGNCGLSFLVCYGYGVQLPVYTSGGLPQ